MVAVRKLRPSISKRKASSARSVGPIRLIKNSFSLRKVSRQSPVLAGLHRATDGALMGVLVAVVMMSAFSLHWRFLWTLAYTRLEATRDLAHRLTDSTAMLERQLLEHSKLPLSMVRTKTSNLIYMDHPRHSRRYKHVRLNRMSHLKKIVYEPVNYGY